MIILEIKTLTPPHSTIAMSLLISILGAVTLLGNVFVRYVDYYFSTISEIER